MCLFWGNIIYIFYKHINLTEKFIHKGVLSVSETEKRRGAIINVLYFAMLIAIGLFIVRYALGVCLPFVIAFVFAAILQKPKNFLVKKTFLKNGSASGLCVLLAIVIAVSLVALIGVRAFEEIRDFVKYIMTKLQNADVVVDNIESWLTNLINTLPEFVKKSLGESVSDFFTSVREYIAGESSKLTEQIGSGLSSKFNLSWITGPLSGVISTAKQLPSILVAVLISIIACCFMTSEFDSIKRFIKNQFPEHRRNDLSRAKVLLTSSLGKMAKAYALIMLVTFVEVAVGLTVLKILKLYSSSYIMVIAAGTAIVDILPIFGTGTVMIPWAAYSLITGDFAFGIGLVVIYVVISIVRQIIEPKLVAGQLGLSPIVTIIALYLGLKVFGVLGMFVTPILVIMIKLLNDEGIIHLWKPLPKEEDEEDAPSAKEKLLNRLKKKAAAQKSDGEKENSSN